MRLTNKNEVKDNSQAVLLQYLAHRTSALFEFLLVF